MKKIVTLNIFIGLLVFILFQNCSIEHGLKGSSSEASLNLLYPYQDKEPLFFEDVQIIGKKQVDNNWIYQFVATASFIENEDTLIDVDLFVLDADNKLVCPRTSARVNRNNNHIQVPDCLTARNLPYIKVMLDINLSSESKKETRIHDFDLTRL